MFRTNIWSLYMKWSVNTNSMVNETQNRWHRWHKHIPIPYVRSNIKYRHHNFKCDVFWALIAHKINYIKENTGTNAQHIFKFSILGYIQIRVKTFWLNHRHTEYRSESECWVSSHKYIQQKRKTEKIVFTTNSNIW